MTHLSPPIACHNHPQSHQIHPHENELRPANIPPVIREHVQYIINIHMAGPIHQGSRSTVDLGVIAFAGAVLRYLLHVCPPIDLGIRNLEYDEGGKNSIGEDEQGAEP